MSAQSSPSGEIIVHVFGKTDVGRTREHNEDTFVVADLTTIQAMLRPEVQAHRPGERGMLFMVADGMGGAAAGEIASQMATEVVLEELAARWRRAQDYDPETFARALKAACEAANAKIHRYATEHPENRGMGTTATIAGLLGDTLYLAQVGDSRAYVIRDGVARQITKDQSLMQKLVEAGELTVEEAEVSERRNIILQALGPEAVVKVDLTSQKLSRGDVLVLCSDGLSGQMRARHIARAITEAPDLATACQQLIDLANEYGGPDNITVIAARFDGEGLQLAANGEDLGHHPYASESGGRITEPMDTTTIPPEDEIEDREYETDPRPGTAEAPRGAAPNPGHAPLATGAGEASPSVPNPGNPGPALAPPPMPAEGRISVGLLRLAFGAIALVILILIFLRMR